MARGDRASRGTLLSAEGLMRAHPRALLLWARASFARCCVLFQFYVVLRVAVAHHAPSEKRVAKESASRVT